MIARVWNGRASGDAAAAYRELLVGTIMPGIAARSIAGYRDYELWERDEADGVTVFTTVMRFDDEAAIANFVGQDVTRANLPEAALELLDSWDERAVHHRVRETGA